MVGQHPAVSTTPPEDDRRRFDLDRFLDDVRRAGTVIDGPVAGEPESPWVEPPLECVVTAHRGTPLHTPLRLRPTSEGIAEAVELDAALAGLVAALHGFVVHEDRLELTQAPPCADVLRHLDPDSVDHGWSAYQPGTPRFEQERAEQERAQQGRRSRHRRHSYRVLGWLEVEAAYENGERMDAAMGYLQDAMGDAFGNEVFQRFSAYVEQHGSPTTVELSAVMHAEDDRFDASLDALAGEPRDG